MALVYDFIAWICHKQIFLARKEGQKRFIFFIMTQTGSFSNWKQATTDKRKSRISTTRIRARCFILEKRPFHWQKSVGNLFYLPIPDIEWSFVSGNWNTVDSEKREEREGMETFGEKKLQEWIFSSNNVFCWTGLSNSSGENMAPAAQIKLKRVVSMFVFLID